MECSEEAWEIMTTLQPASFTAVNTALAVPGTRGLHSSTFRLNCSAFCGTGVAFRGCLGGVAGVLRISRGC